MRPNPLAIFWRLCASVAILGAVLASPITPRAARAGPPSLIYLPVVLKGCSGRCFFVSSSAGSDANSGADLAHPFKTLAKVNSLALGSGDTVFLKCGDTWRGEVLRVTRSGQAGGPITYTSYPEKCANQPRIDGTQPVTGWSMHSTNLYYSYLGGGQNAARFNDLSGANAGINQLFRAGARLPMGRWPNIGEAGFDQGYSAVDAQPAGGQLRDDQLVKNFPGGTIHLKVIRWSMVNRNITAQSGSTLTLNAPVTCWNNACAGWGYFVNNHLNTLDQEGEWYYDKASRWVYLYTTADPNAALIEASVDFGDESRNLGLINLGTDSAAPVHDVVVENLEARGSWLHGIASPTNLHPDENSAIVLRGNTIRDADGSGIDLWSWVWGAADGLDGWRGGKNLLIADNRILGANQFGIHTPSRLTTITGNTLQDIALIANLNEAGMGCGITGSEGSCTECGTGLRIYTDDPARSGYGFTISGNRFERVGYHGIQTFGGQSTISANVFVDTCASKGDCGAINTFGNASMAGTYVHDIQILNNLILNTIGNSDGAAPTFHSAFGFGIYLDHYSRDITARGNTVAYSSATGILYQDASGVIAENTLFQNGQSGGWYAQAALSGSAQVASFDHNILVSHTAQLRNLSLPTAGRVTAADYNRYYHSLNPGYQVVAGGTNYSLAQWQAASPGKDVYSVAGTTAFSASLRLYVNDSADSQTITAASGGFADLDGLLIGTSFILAPFSSRVVALTP